MIAALGWLVGCQVQGSLPAPEPVHLTYTDPDGVVWENPECEILQREFTGPGCSTAVWSQVSSNGIPWLYLWYPDPSSGTVTIEADVEVVLWNHEASGGYRRTAPRRYALGGVQRLGASRV